MKKFLLLILLSISIYSHAQVVNQVTMIPANPSSADTISIIANFSYYGACTFGVVGYFYQLQGSTIYIIPTYCGYGATTLCTSTDTFKLETYPSGIYNINIEFHQGSICPFSGFDATIAQFDTTINITTASGLNTHNYSESEIFLYPNPTTGDVTLNFKKHNLISVSLYNSLGILVEVFYSTKFSISRLPNGVYWTSIKTDRGQSNIKIVKR